MDRVVGVLKEVRAQLEDEAVRVTRRAIRVLVSGTRNVVGTLRRERRPDTGSEFSIVGDGRARTGKHAVASARVSIRAGCEERQEPTRKRAPSEDHRCGSVRVRGGYEKSSQVSVVCSHPEIVAAQVVDADDFVRTVEEDDVAVGGLPFLPHVSRCRRLEPRQLASRSDGRVAGLEADVVHTEDLDRHFGARCREVFLEGVEVTKLATAVASGGVSEVPTRNLRRVVLR